MFTPFAKRESKGESDKPRSGEGGGGEGGGGEIDELKRQMEEMQKRLERLGKKD
jgi:hypothetical protein